MNSASKHAAIALFVVCLSGCTAKNASTAPPAQAQAPAVQPSAESTPTGKAGAMYPPPLTQTETQTQQPAPAPPPVVAVQQPPPPPQPAPADAKKSTSRKAKPAKPAATQPASGAASGGDTPNASPAAPNPTEKTADVGATETTVATVANNEPAAASPIGQLTTGDVAGQAQKGKETNDLIASTENGLNAIKRQLSAQEQETVTQIRTFLNKAKLALGNEDVDGAQILATKAKVLLDELNKS